MVSTLSFILIVSHSYNRLEAVPYPPCQVACERTGLLLGQQGITKHPGIAGGKLGGISTACSKASAQQSFRDT